jgi:beta-glucanase (GH16 family)
MKNFFLLLLLLYPGFCSICLTSCGKQMNKIEMPAAELTVSKKITGNGICDYNINESTIISEGYTKIFEDDLSNDLHKWTMWIGGAYNHELQCYQASNMLLLNGNLVISPKKETVRGFKTQTDHHLKTFNYTSGRIESKTYFTPSASAGQKMRISARIKCPPGYGMWPAFWTYNDPWPTKGEIDIIESKGQEPFQYTTNYYYGTEADKPLTNENKTTGYISSDVSLTNCYHVYELIWSRDSLVYLFDGKIVDKKNGKYIPEMFGKKERITLNVAVGGNYFVNFDSSNIETGPMYVDWIKVFSAN